MQMIRNDQNDKTYELRIVYISLEIPLYETQYNINQGERKKEEIVFFVSGDGNQSIHFRYTCIWISLALRFSCGENETKNQSLNKH